MNVVYLLKNVFLYEIQSGRDFENNGTKLPELYCSLQDRARESSRELDVSNLDITVALSK